MFGGAHDVWRSSRCLEELTMFGAHDVWRSSRCLELTLLELTMFGGAHDVWRSSRCLEELTMFGGRCSRCLELTMFGLLTRSKRAGSVTSSATGPSYCTIHSNPAPPLHWHTWTPTMLQGRSYHLRSAALEKAFRLHHSQRSSTTAYITHMDMPTIFKYTHIHTAKSLIFTHSHTHTQTHHTHTHTQSRKAETN